MSVETPSDNGSMAALMPSSPTARPSLAARVPFFYGWIVIAVAFVTMAIGANTRTVFSLLFPAIPDEFAWDRGVTAAAFSIGFISSTLYAPIIGLAMDRVGARWVISIGAMLASGGLVLATIAREPWHFYLTLGVLVVGASSLLSYIGHMVFLPNWFVRKRGLALGVAFSGVGVGSILLLPWFQAMIDNLGWREGCWALAGLLAVILVPLNLLLQRGRPEDIGLAPDGDSLSHRVQEPGRKVDNVVDPAWVATDWTLARAIRSKRFWLIAGGFFCAMFVWYAILVHQTKYLLDIGFTAEHAAYALGLVGLLGVVGQPTLGYLSDRIGREWVWSLSTLGFVTAYALLIVIKHQPSLGLVYLMVASQGLLGYGLASVYSAVPADIFQGKHYGTIFGTLTVAGSTGAGAGPWAAGELYDLTGSYSLPFWMAIAMAFLSSVCIWLAAPRKVRAVAGKIAGLKNNQPS